MREIIVKLKLRDDDLKMTDEDIITDIKYSEEIIGVSHYYDIESIEVRNYE